MAFSNNFAKYVILILLLYPLTIHASKLNVPRVLLPVFTDFSTNFVLEATEGGCYKWSTTRSDIIQITPLDEEPNLHCSTKVIVNTVTKEAARNIAVVLAEDVNTQQTLRCDVIVDVIHELQISTTTRELFMEEAPEIFEVKAFDDQGNEFSTLEGIDFDWAIVTLGPARESVLRYITFRDSPYETPPAIELLEKENKKGYAILLEGVKSGSAKLNNGRMEEVVLPDAQYYLEAENAEIALSNKKTGSITGLKEGNTRIVLRDRNVGKDDPVLKLPTANLHVVQPAYMVLNVMPHKNWAILVADNHDIVAEIYSSNDHKLFIGPSVQIYMEVTPEFTVVSRSTNGSWLTGYGTKPSVATVQATLDGVFNEKTGKIKFDAGISATGDLMIYPRITIEPSQIFLPWDPLTKPKYDIDLVAKGGDGRFLWTSSNHSIGVVSQTGHVHTYSDGFFEVSAVMQRNHHNRGSASVIILPPTRLEIVEFVMETEVGSPVYLHIGLFADNIPFTQCQSLPFHIKTTDSKFKQSQGQVVKPIGISCGNIAMTALEVGNSKVTVTYYQDGKALEDSATISAFKPLNLIHPKNDAVLAVGSTTNLVFSGGPRPMLGRSSEHSRVVVSEDESIVQAIDVTPLYTLPAEDYTVIEVVCKKLGETDIKLIISNAPTTSNCKSKTSTAVTKIICGKPRKISLQPESPLADPSACPMDLSSGNVVVHNSGDVDIEVHVYDDTGTKFLNISSLLLDWSVTPPTEANVEVSDGVFLKNLSIGNVPLSHKSFQRLKPTPKNLSERNSDCYLNVTVRGYNPTIIRKRNIVPESPEFVTSEDKIDRLPPITTSLHLYLVKDVVLSQDAVTIFNHPGNKHTITLQQGSGYFKLGVSSEKIARVIYSESSREIEISPLTSGEMTVEVLDLCLIARPAVLIITVVSVGIIRVEMADKVEVGKCLSSIVRLYDENDNLLEIPDKIGLIDIRAELKDPIANVQRDEKPDENSGEQWGMGEMHFTITGISPGTTKLTFTVLTTDGDVTSAPIDLQVFNPLKISPRNGTILIGSEFQMLVLGGPLPDAEIVFSTNAPNIAHINERGILRGKSVGLTKIKAKAVGIHPATGDSLLYSEDEVDIEVVRLQRIKIVTPLSRFRIGAVVPFWCVGVPDISPMIMGSVENPPINFKWSSENKLLIDLSGVFHPLGIFKRRYDREEVKVTGLAPGITKLFVNATVPGPTLNIYNVETMILSASHDIEVIQEFILLNPPIPGNLLLMAPFSELQLTTNFDEIYNISYLLPGNKISTTQVLAGNSGTPDVIVTVSPSGLLRSHGVYGHTLLLLMVTDDVGHLRRLSIVVKVKPIHYMNLNIQAAWRISSDQPLRTVPLGTEFQLKATFHDNYGNIFHAGPKDLKVRLNRCDLLEVRPGDTEASVWIHTKKEGVTMVKGWAEGIENTADYIKIRVQQSVQPQVDHLTTGDVICLRTPVVDQFMASGTWRTSDPGLLKINPALDIGFVGDKEGVVILTHSLLSWAPIPIQIYPTSEIEFLEDPTIILTNGALDTVTRFILVMQSEESIGKKTNNLIQGWRCRSDVRKLMRPTTFKCYAKLTNESLSQTIDSLFNVSNSWVPETGQYACKLINLGVSGKEISMLHTNVSVWATTLDEEISSKKLHVPFLPGIYVDKTIDIGTDGLTGELIITGLQQVLDQVLVQPADSSILYVDKGTLINENEKKYQVQLIDYHWRLANLEEAMGILILSPITNQKLHVIVKVTGELGSQICSSGRSPIATFLFTYKYAIAMTTAMMIIFLLTFYFYSNYMQPIVNVNVNPNRSLIQGDSSRMMNQTTSSSPFTCSSANTCAANNYAANLSRVSPDSSQSQRAGCRYNCKCSLHNSSGYGSTYFRNTSGRPN